MLTAFKHRRHRPRSHQGDETQAQAREPRNRRWAVGLAAAAVLAIAVHLGLGGALLAAPSWTGPAADVVLALVVLKVIALTVIALRRRAHRRSGSGTAPASSGSPQGLGQKLVLKSGARVRTPRGERYAKQLCGHAARMNCRAEWTPPEGVIEFPDDMGTCRVTVEPDQLVLAVEATDSANLDRLQRVLSRNIDRFGSREGLKVQWVQD
jgi:hypothetical protein